MHSISGLYYYQNVISPEFSHELSQYLESTDDFKPLNSSKNSRQVIHYGFNYNYKTKNIYEVAPDMPPIIHQLRELIRIHQDTPTEQFNQCIINKYEIGQGISPHIDLVKYGPTICCFSLGSTAIMEFNRNNKNTEVFIEPDSLYVMSDEARYKYTHSMPQRKYDIHNKTTLYRKIRYSITFRSVK